MGVTSEQMHAFARACELAANTLRGQNGIGSLGEKTLHLALKYFYEPNAENHERPIQGYVADAFGENGIIEIQTAQLRRLYAKLEAFLPISDVLVVCPLVTKKWLIWVDPIGCTFGEKRRVAVRSKALSIVGDLYALKPYLTAPGFSVEIAALTMEEYRLLDGYGEQKKKQATKYEKVPIELCDLIRLSKPADYAALLPAELPPQFTSEDLKKTAKIRREDAQKALNVLFALEVVERVGKRGQAYLYEKTVMGDDI